MALLALDLGAKRTGVALSTSGTLVTPVGTIPSLPRPRFTAALRRLIEEHGVTTIIVGESGLDSFGEAAGVVQLRLSQQFKLPVVVVPETETTNEAQRRTGRADHADTTAASVILERYLEDYEPSP